MRGFSKSVGEWGVDLRLRPRKPSRPPQGFTSCGQQGRAMSIGNEKRSEADGYVCVCVCVCMRGNRNRQLFEPLFLPFLASPIPFLLYPSPFQKAPCPLLLLFLPKSPKSDKSPNFHRNDWLLRAIKNSTGERREKYAERSFFSREIWTTFGTLYF